MNWYFVFLNTSRADASAKKKIKSASLVNESLTTTSIVFCSGYFDSLCPATMTSSAINYLPAKPVLSS